MVIQRGGERVNSDDHDERDNGNGVRSCYFQPHQMSSSAVRGVRAEKLGVTPTRLDSIKSCGRSRVLAVNKHSGDVTRLRGFASGASYFGRLDY